MFDFYAPAALWVTIAVYLGLRTLDTDEREYVNDSSIGGLGTFLSLVLAFFINQSRSDFQAAYTTSMTAKGEFPTHAEIMDRNLAVLCTSIDQ